MATAPPVSPGPESQKAFAADREPDRSPLVGPTIGDGEPDNLVVEAFRGGEIGHFEHHLEQAACDRHWLLRRVCPVASRRRRCVAHHHHPFSAALTVLVDHILLRGFGRQILTAAQPARRLRRL
jgi:hypothetical protein